MLPWVVLVGFQCSPVEVQLFVKSPNWLYGEVRWAGGGGRREDVLDVDTALGVRVKAGELARDGHWAVGVWLEEVDRSGDLGCVRLEDGNNL